MCVRCQNGRWHFQKPEVKMFAYLWPVILVMIANIVYQVCAKEVPAAMNAFASITICYGIATVMTLVCFFVFSGGGISGLAAEYAKANWAAVVFGLTAVGLEVGYVFAYKNGWEVSLLYIMQSAIMAVMLLLVGYFLYSEEIPWNKLAGIAICLAGLVLINKKGGTK